MTLAVFNRVGKLPVVNKILNKSVNKILFLSSFNTFVGILYGPVAFLMPSDQRVSLTSSLSIVERKRGFEFAFVR